MAETDMATAGVDEARLLAAYRSRVAANGNIALREHWSALRPALKLETRRSHHAVGHATLP